MDPDKFRKSRQEINRMYKKIMALIDQNELESSKERHQEVSDHLDKLTPQAEGEIQKRSVKNLSVRLHSLSIQIDKLKPAKKPAGSRRKKEATPAIVWDEERLGQLPEAFLKKVFQNMGNDADATVCFGTTGKGIRPSYQVVFGDKKGTAFSGSGHNPLKKPLSKASKKISQPFSHGVIDSILLKK